MSVDMSIPIFCRLSKVAQPLELMPGLRAAQIQVPRDSGRLLQRLRSPVAAAQERVAKPRHSGAQEVQSLR